MLKNVGKYIVVKTKKIMNEKIILKWDKESFEKCIWKNW